MTPKCIPRRKGNRDPHRNLDTYVHSGTIRNSWKVEKPQMSISARLNKQDVVPPSSGLFVQWKHYVGERLVTKGPKLYDSILVKHPEQKEPGNR